MNYKMIGKLIGHILLVEAVFMLPALFISLYQRENMAVKGFLLSICAIVLVAVLLIGICKGGRKGFKAREGLVCVGMSWTVMSLLGCLPLYLSGEIPNYLDALFETVSGFTTTGATILSDIEKLSMGNLYWRSFTHWLGGMGVLVFILAIGSISDGSNGFTMYLLRAESPGPNVGKLVPKMRQTAGILYWIYILLTVLNIIFLLLGRMPLFDAVCTAFGTVGTGGFGIKNDSIAGYSPYIQNVCIVFMLLCGINFGCYYMLIAKQFYSIFHDEELKLYIGIILCSIILITLNVRGFYATIGETVRNAAFQVVSIITTTGFATVDFDLWPTFSKAILLALTAIGASAGSTGGGFKCARVLLILKILRRNIRQVLYPQKVQVVKVNNHMMDEKVLENTNAYLAVYVMILFLSFLLISMDKFSVTTGFTAVLTCFNNVGPGLEAVGPVCNYGAFSWFSKLVLIFDMLAGRLEIFPILILFSRSTWGRR